MDEKKDSKNEIAKMYLDFLGAYKEYEKNHNLLRKAFYDSMNAYVNMTTSKKILVKLKKREETPVEDYEELKQLVSFFKSYIDSKIDVQYSFRWNEQIKDELKKMEVI